MQKGPLWKTYSMEEINKFGGDGLWINQEIKEDSSQETKVKALLELRLKQAKREVYKTGADTDHTIALFSRQKKRSLTIILLTLFLCLAVHALQFLALYNYSILASIIFTSDVDQAMESGFLANPHIDTNPFSNLSVALRVYIGRGEFDIAQAPALGFCMTKTGEFDIAFNIVFGVLLVYVFIFGDFWRVIFGTRITRSFPNKGEPHWQIMLLGTLVLTAANAGIQAWLGVVAGYSVISTGGNFAACLINSLSIFIILVIDDKALPLIRYFIEEIGSTDIWGNLYEERLALLYHGAQYHSPGYGTNWGKHLTQTSKILRIVSIMLLIFTLGFLFIPLGITIAEGVKAYQAC